MIYIFIPEENKGYDGEGESEDGEAESDQRDDGERHFMHVVYSVVLSVVILETHLLLWIPYYLYSIWT